MKYKSALLVQASGSLAGITFSHNSGGLYTRARSIPVNANTALQQVVRNAMGGAQAAWKALTDEVRSSWAAYADGTPVANSLGDSIKLSGLAMFLRQYIHRAQNGVTQITTAPPTPGLGGLSPLVVTEHATANTFSVAYDNGDPWAITTGGYLALYQSPPVNPTVNFYKGPFKLAGKVVGNTAAPPASPLALTSLYPFVAGQRYILRGIAVDSEGRMSASQFHTLDPAGD